MTYFAERMEEDRRLMAEFGCGIALDDDWNYSWKRLCHYGNKKDFIKNSLEMYFGNVFDESYPTFEEMLALIDISVQRNEVFSCDERFDLADFKGRIIDTIKETIEYFQRKSKYTYCNKLVENLLKLNKLDETVFITTNYDLFLDKAIRNINRTINYGFDDIIDNNADK